VERQLPEPSLCFEATPALLEFRRLAGDANRHLNTLLVGLETLRGTSPVRPNNLIVPWSKPSIAQEWSDARLFALRGAMIAVVDGLDQYLRMLSQVEGLIESGLDGVLNARRLPPDNKKPSMSQRLAAVDQIYPSVMGKENIAAAGLLAMWRNRFVHRNDKTGLSLAEKRRLVSGAAYFKSEMAGVDIRALIQRFENQEPPTLSDLGCLIASTHRAATALDGHLLFLQAGKSYALALVKFLIKQEADPSACLEEVFQHGGKRSAGKIHAWLLDNGANHNPVNRKAHAPSVTRRDLAAVLGVGRNKASEVLGIPRPNGQ